MIFSASGQMDAHSLAALRRKLLAQFKTILGTRLAAIGLGGAASSPVVKEFLVECYGPIVADGYGSTEAGSIARDDGTIASTLRYSICRVDARFGSQNIFFRWCTLQVGGRS